MSEKIRKFLDSLPTRSTLEAFDNERYFGVVVKFSEAGFGFGEITFSVSKATGTADCDLEEMTPTLCGNLLMRAVGTTVGDGNLGAAVEREEGTR